MLSWEHFSPVDVFWKHLQGNWLYEWFGLLHIGTASCFAFMLFVSCCRRHLEDNLPCPNHLHCTVCIEVSMQSQLLLSLPAVRSPSSPAHTACSLTSWGSQQYGLGLSMAWVLWMKVETCLFHLLCLVLATCSLLWLWRWEEDKSSFVTENILCSGT